MGGRGKTQLGHYSSTIATRSQRAQARACLVPPFLKRAARHYGTPSAHDAAAQTHRERKVEVVLPRYYPEVGGSGGGTAAAAARRSL